MTPRRLLRIASALLAAGAVFAGGSHPGALAADQPPPVGFGVSPVDGDQVGQRALFTFGLPPGGVAYDKVAIVNYASGPVSYELYAADALNSDDGSFALTEASVTARDLGRWITFGSTPRSVLVPGRTADGQPGTLVVPVQVAVPKDASPGDHAAGIVASLTTLAKNAESQNIQLEQRVAARVYVRVAGAAAPALTISDLKATYEASPWPWQPGRVVVDYDIVNSGNIRMGVQPRLELAGPFGIGSQSLDQQRVPELLPHQGSTARVVVDGVWPLGPTTVSLTATPAAAVAAPIPDVSSVSRSALVWALTWWLLLLMLLLVVAAYLLVRSRRSGGRSRGRHSVPRRSPATAAPHERTLVS
jgi:hypothetical protein